MGESALSGIENANDLLRRVGAEDILVLLRKLGFWVGDGARNPQKPFPSNLSRLESGALGDEAAYWQSELSRVISISGALRGHRQTLETELKRTQAAAMVTVIESVPEGEKQPTRDVLAAKVAGRPEVRDIEDAVGALKSCLTALEAVGVAYEGYTRVLSREISRRGDLLKARVER